MGSDIHSVAQVFRAGCWVTVLTGVAGDEHNYHMFGLLAGVRDPNVEPIVEPRGLPDDFEIINGDEHPTPPGTPTETPERDATEWIGDHSYSWYTLDELIPHADRDSDLGEVCASLIRVAKKHGVSSPHVRYVFGFDS